MNQILFSYDNSNLYNKIVNKKKKTFYFYIFLFLIFVAIFIFIYIIYHKYIIYQKNSNSSDILNAYNISTLYSNSSNYNAIELSNDISIIGLIEIPSINISYPILSKSNEELLKISVCRFARSNA